MHMFSSDTKLLRLVELDPETGCLKVSYSFDNKHRQAQIADATTVERLDCPTTRAS